MRALLICTEKLPVPPVRGGAIQTYIAAIAPQLARNHSVTVLGVSDPELPDRETRDGVTYVRIPGGSFPRFQAGVEEFLKTEGKRYQLIHIFNRPKMVLPVRKAAPKARLILSLHNEMFRPGKIEPDEAKKVIAAVERIITVSDFIGKGVEALYPSAKGKWRTIYSGVDLSRFAPVWTSEARRMRSRLRSQHELGDGPVILFVGRLSPKKGADIVVRAMEEVARKHSDANLVLVGSKWYGEDRISDYVAYVRALADRAPLKVHTTGFVPADEVHHWFSAGDLFVCASQWEEPLARVHYEAMASGLPIITTARGGNPEVVRGQGNGIVVEEPENPSAFAKAITKLLGDSRLRAEMGRRGRALSEERFGWDRVVREIRSVWERG
ncbi:MAG: glycosyltransferase family 4 protein [Bacillota bacterium]